MGNVMCTCGSKCDPHLSLGPFQGGRTRRGANADNFFMVGS